MSRTQQEIVDRYRAGQKDDYFGWDAEVLLSRLDAEHFKEFAKPDADLSNWKPMPTSREAILEEMRSYMEFAWGKALGHRGISASRSVEKMKSWLWLLGDDELATFAGDDGNYAQYGAPVLMAVSEKYGFEIPEGEEARRMAQGLSCFDGCENGCGA